MTFSYSFALSDILDPESEFSWEEKESLITTHDREVEDYLANPTFARGELGSKTSTADTGTSGATYVDTPLTVTFSPGRGRRVKTTISGHWYGATAGDTVRIGLRDSSGTTLHEWDFVGVGVIAQAFTVYHIETPAGPSITRKVSLKCAAGAGVVHLFADSTRIAMLTVEDVGKA